MFVPNLAQVTKYSHGGYGIGALVLNFDSIEQMCEMIDSMNEYIIVSVR